MDSARTVSRRLAVDGVWMHAAEAGAGRPVVLVHGFPTHAFLWRKVQEALSARYRTFAVDLPGFGRSEKPERSDFSVESLAERLAGFLVKLDVGPVALVTHDFAAAVALSVADRFPGVLSSLSLVSPRTAPTWPPADLKRFPFELSRRMAVDDLLRYLRETFAVQIADGARLEKSTVEAYLEPWSTPAALGAWFQLARDAESAADLLAEPPRLHVPALVACGTRDRLVPASEAKKLATLVRGAEYASLGEVGHLSPEEDPRAVALVVDRFLESRSPRA